MCGWSFCLRTNLLRPLSNGCEQCLAEAAVGGYRLENVFRASIGEQLRSPALGRIPEGKCPL
jgi:hypothetical protein